MVNSVKFLNAANAYNTAANQKIIPSLEGIGELGKANKPNESAFSSLVGESIDKAAATIKAGETTAVKALLNEATMAELATAVTDAELTLKTVASVRDKIISAYQDIIKMPI